MKGLNSTGYYALPPRHPRDVPAGTAGMFGITVKTVCGRKQEFNVYPDMRGLDLKAWLKPETKAVTGQRLIFEGLDVDDLLTLAEQGLKAGAIVFRLPLVGFFAPHKRYANPPVEKVMIRCIPNNQCLNLNVTPSTSVAQLTGLLDSTFGHRKGTYYRIFYRGVALGEKPHDAVPDLEGYGVCDNAQMYLFLLKDSNYQS